MKPKELPVRAVPDLRPGEPRVYRHVPRLLLRRNLPTQQEELPLESELQTTRAAVQPARAAARQGPACGQAAAKSFRTVADNQQTAAITPDAREAA